MAKLFGNYDRPGPGVSRGADEGHGFGRYFVVLFRKFWSLAFVNLIYLIVLIPVAAIISGLLALALRGGYGENGIVLLLCFAPVILLAPANAGLTRITRDFARGEPCFIWQDFWESAKKNWKQSTAVSVIGYVGISAFIMVISFYHGLMGEGFLSKLPFAFALVLLFLFLSMLMYLQLMAVTLNLKMRPMLKNAAILSIACLGKNFLALLGAAIYLGLYALIFYLSLSIQGALILLVVVTLMLIAALLSYTLNYVAFPVIQQYILDPYYRENPEQTAEGLRAAIEKAEDDDQPEEEAELPEYVYENGRMVHRSVAQSRSIFDDEPPKPPTKRNE